MNQQADDQPGGGSTYSSQPGTQTNPFTADLKGEFTNGGFGGTNTNAVSQIFKEGQFSQSRSKILIGVLVVVLLGAAAYFLMGDESADTGGQEETQAQSDDGQGGDEASDEGAAAEGDGETEGSGAQTAAEGGDSETAAEAEPKASAPAEAAKTAEAMPAATDAPVLSGPPDGASRGYDETSGAAEFSWQGSPGGYIIFSRSSSMTPEVMRVRVGGNSYLFEHPWPGTWHWQVENGAGKSEVRSFRISAPVRRNIQLAEPQPGAAVSGNGGLVSWTGDTNVAFYRVELSTGSWANPQHRFATSGTQVQLQGVQAGQYQLRVGAFSEVSGRWEYTNPIAVTVQ